MTFPNLFSSGPSSTTCTECVFSGIMPLFSQTGGFQNRLFEIILVPVGASKKSVEIRLSDSDDPFFMYSSCITEEDFYSLKRDQGLVIDFNSFPFKLIDLLNQCISHSREAFPPSFYTSFSEGMLSFIEVTSLRQIAHLNIRLAAVNESILKKHLLDIYRQQRDEIHTLKSLSSTQKLSVTPVQMAQNQGQTFGSSPSSTKFCSTGLLGLSGNFVERCKQLEERVQLLDSSNSHLKQQNSHLESTKANLESNISLIQEESKKIKVELGKLKELATAKGYTAQISGLEQALRDKDLAITRLNDLLTNANEAKIQLESSNKHLRESITNSDREISQNRAEISKANDIIKRMQEEIKNLKATNKSHSHLIGQQESIINDLRSQYDLNKRELVELRELLDKRIRELGQKDAEIASVKQTETEHKIRIEGLSAVIRTLNRAIEERGIDPFDYTAAEKQTRHQPALESEEDFVESSGLEDLLKRYSSNYNGGYNKEQGAGEEELDSGELSALLRATLNNGHEKSHHSETNNKQPGFPRFFDDIAKINSHTIKRQQLTGSSPSPPPASSSSSSPPTSVQA